MNQKLFLAIAAIIGVSLVSLLLFRFLLWVILSIRLAFREKKFTSSSKESSKKLEKFKKNSFPKNFPKSAEDLTRRKSRPIEFNQNLAFQINDPEQENSGQGNGENYQRIGGEGNSELNQEESPKIVGFAKPIGKWTALILGRKLSDLLMNLNSSKRQNLNFGDLNNSPNRLPKGYWTNMVANSSSGRNRGRGI